MISTQNWKEKVELSHVADDTALLLKGGDNAAYGNGLLLPKIRFLVQNDETKEEAMMFPEESLADTITLRISKPEF